jgi:hypothetical protein
VVAKIRERLSVSKQVTQRFDMERPSLKKLKKSKIGDSISLKSKTVLQHWRT